MEPLRVLSIVSAMDRGGIETWLMHILRAADRSQLAMDIYATSGRRGAYDEEIEALGAKVHYGPGLKHPRHLPHLMKVLREGRYRIVHGHMEFVSGLHLPAARMAGVPGRIAHSHTIGSDKRITGLRAAVRRALIAAARASMTRGVGITEQAAAAMFGPRWREDPRMELLYYGFDFSHFAEAADRAGAVRERLGIAPDAVVIGHIGRFVPFKNHAFLLEVFARVAAREPKAVLLLIGAGPLEADVRAQAAALGVADRVVFAGLTSDVAGHAAAMDVFMLPSWAEGFGIVGLEAQAAGAYCLFSAGVPPETRVIEDRVQVLPLEAGADAWADAALAPAARGPVDRAAALAEIEAGRFGVRRCLADLQALYRRALGEGA